MVKPLELEVLMDDEIYIDGSRDHCGDVAIYVTDIGRNRSVAYINKEHAEKIITHLQKVFELGIAITK